ncbi:hypothetical protein M8C21_012514 [Ambrosia artemisiifolia]|uniref:Uncharacterized protein n=1 Tax=Ambrosia artemisiifolia TaxID=4212 RepID=A0AAD5CIL9_AMBAR|nr:hypothetical protein M8C21_012514 [Ambrosia artemisiifolia]
MENTSYFQYSPTPTPTAPLHPSLHTTSSPLDLQRIACRETKVSTLYASHANMQQTPKSRDHEDLWACVQP